MKEKVNIKRIYQENKEFFKPVFLIALPTIADMFVQTELLALETENYDF